MWPDVACDSPWLDEPAQRAQREGSEEPKKYVAEDWRGDLEIVPRLPLDGPPDTRRCLVWYYYEEDCDLHVRAPLPARIAQTCPPALYAQQEALSVCKPGKGQRQIFACRAHTGPSSVNRSFPTYDEILCTCTCHNRQLSTLRVGLTFELMHAEVSSSTPSCR